MTFAAAFDIEESRFAAVRAQISIGSANCSPATALVFRQLAEMIGKHLGHRPSGRLRTRLEPDSETQWPPAANARQAISKDRCRVFHFLT